jgi:hypothetical protein
VHLVPTDNIDVVVAFRYQDSIVAAGNIDLTLGTFDPNSIPQTNDNRDVTKVQQDMPWKLTAGIRYAQRLAPRPTGTGQGQSGAYEMPAVRDAFSDERWDVELDVVYEMNSRNQQQRIEFRPGQSLYTMNIEGTEGAVVFPEATRPFANIEKHWQDQVSVRAGGSYNIAPGIFGVSAGAHVENRGIDPSYMQVDYWPLARLGLHTGIRLRVLEGTDILVSYAHIFQETLEVAAPAHRPGTDIDAEYQQNRDAPINGIDKSIGFMRGRSDPPPPVVEERNRPSSPDGVARVSQVTTRSEPGRPPYIVNAGKYVSSIDVVSVGVHAHF